MVPLTTLWVPILLSAVIVFVASSILHMVIPIHKSDYRTLPDEDKVTDALRSAGVTPGPMYHFPHTTMKDMKSSATVEKFKRGPVGFLIIRPSGPPGFVKNLVQWFVYSIVVSIFAAYLTGRTRPIGANYLEVFRVAGCASFMAYGLSQLQDSIWKSQTWGVTIKHVIDGLIYGLLTAGTFGWLWPR